MTIAVDDIIEETTTTTRTVRRKPKAVKPAPEVTHVSLLIDETGSMANIREKTLSAVNEYLDTLRTQGQPYRVSLSMFNSVTGCRSIYVDRQISDVARLTEADYHPAMWTPLYDAVGLTIQRMAEHIKGSARVLFVLQTDGEENASRQFNQYSINTLRAIKEREGWTFLFLGADLSAAQAQYAAGMMGFGAGNTVTYGKGETVSVMRSMAGASQSYAHTQSVGESSQQFFNQHGDSNLKSKTTQPK